ncbi:hypothetical protein PVAND_017011 [Polypedilum vanderplanki]|uniref:Fatty acyl-CoA reductase n=1 Tax=Polypedilum vanderplanki TaxID=319348 RepID=A0A9J6BHV8_POLVA|nr:hypothetical protein PVAND_017011 [Polypedilum vanderplanki]
MRINAKKSDTSHLLQNASIADFYANKNIFITGATGFMGKVLLETLLRKCGQINCIYILVRMKRGVDPVQRYHDYVDDMIFDNIRNTTPERLTKIKLISGDITEENLGIGQKDELELIENVHILFHCAAKAKFSLTLRDALSFNLHGTLRVLHLAEKMRNLLVFSHFSTSYCNPNFKVLEEAYIEPFEDPFNVIKALTSGNEKDLETMEPKLMRGMPNTYAVSKLLTEELVFRFSDRINFVITRPAVVISAWQEPYPGYVDNKKNGMIGPMMARASGALRTILSNPNKLIEFIPVDIATHAIIAMTCKRGLLEGNEILYCNIVDTKTKPWTFKQYFDLEMETFYKYPLRNQLWWPYCVITGNKFYYNFRRVFYHYLPAAIGDFFTIVFRRKPQLIFVQRKFDRGMKTLGFYNRREYLYKNEQFLNLPKEMNEKDRELFYCDFERLNMEEVLRNYVLGVRKFILKITDTDSLEFRRGLLTLYWYVDLLVLIIFYAVAFAVILLLLLFLFDREGFLKIFNDLFKSFMFLAQNNFVIKDEVLEKCNRS